MKNKNTDNLCGNCRICKYYAGFIWSCNICIEKNKCLLYKKDSYCLRNKKQKL